MDQDARGQAVVIEHVGECRCPGTPHASGETVELRPSVSLAMGTAAMSARRDAGSVDELVGLLAPVYLRFGIERWTCLDAAGPLAVTSEAIAERFPWGAGGYELSERCDALYAEELVRPLLERITRLSSPGPTGPSTPPTPGSGDGRRSSRRPSSPGSTAGSPSGDPAP